MFDGTMDGLLTAVFDAFLLKEQPEQLLAEGDALPLFCDHTYHVTTDEEKARRHRCFNISVRCSVRAIYRGTSLMLMCWL